MDRSAPEPGVAGAVQEGNDFPELGDGLIGEVGAVNGGGVVVLAREEADQVLHGLQPLRRSLLYRRVILHLGEAKQLDRHRTGPRGTAEEGGRTGGGAAAATAVAVAVAARLSISQAFMETKRICVDEGED